MYMIDLLKFSLFPFLEDCLFLILIHLHNLLITLRMRNIARLAYMFCESTSSLYIYTHTHTHGYTHALIFNLVGILSISLKPSECLEATSRAFDVQNLFTPHAYKKSV